VEGAVSYLRDLYARIWDGTHTALVNASGALSVESTITDGTNTAGVVSPSSPTAAYGGKGLRVIIGPTDPISNLPVTIPYDHHQIHEGEAWHLDSYVLNLASGSSYDIVFTVPNIAITGPLTSAVLACPHFRYVVSANDLAQVFLYEGPTVTAATGTAGAWINFERNGSYTAKTTILLAPTITGVGTLIDTEYFMSIAEGKSTTSGGSVEEFVLKNNTKYLYRVTSGSNGCDIHTNFFMYEDLGV
jgi:hypothetical protein